MDSILTNPFMKNTVLMSAIYKKVLETGHVCQFHFIVYHFSLTNSTNLVFYILITILLLMEPCNLGMEWERESQSAFLSTVNHCYDPWLLQTLKYVIVQNLWLLTDSPQILYVTQTVLLYYTLQKQKQTKNPKLMFIMYRSLIFI